jgi:hypothetical protein
MLTVLHDCFQNDMPKNERYQYAGTLCEMLRGEFEEMVSDDAEGGRAAINVAERPVQLKELVKYHEAWKAFCDQEVQEEVQERQVSTLE